ncbi:hypothetical protein CYY_000718 [Polysphondylium violaceum]|uniref:FNIP repeat-containing protein n=1 Tax=Polysphondylium violaceum TaxID=133409 RepID=A0A8J4Q4D2_9MYCE|nr:hypothetical protein CYY_000718 [Polysphondylium violaceum]
MNTEQLFFSVFRNKPLRQKIFHQIFYSYYDYHILKNICQLDRQFDRLSKLYQYNVPIVYNLATLDNYHIYNSHPHKYLITHFILSTSFYTCHMDLLDQKTRENPSIIFGISIDNESDPIIDIDQLPKSIKYFRNTIRLKSQNIPPSVTSVHIHAKSLEIGAIPSKVKTLVAFISSPGRKIILDPHAIPSSVTSFSYYEFNSCMKYVDLNKLPTGLRYLNINSEVKGNGYGSLKYLTFNLFRKEVTKVDIPKSVTQLRLSGIESFSMVNFPPNLVHLELEKKNTGHEILALPKALPPKLKTLLLKNFTNKDMSKDICPPGVLHFANEFNRTDRSPPFIPPSATKVSICTDEIVDQLPYIPPTVTDLKLKRSTFIDNGLSPYNNIVKLYFQHDGHLCPGDVPSSVTDLTLEYSKSVDKGVIPNSVTKLSLVCNSPVKPIIIPDSVTTLSFEHQIQLFYPIDIPSSVTKLKCKGLVYDSFSMNLFKNTLSTLCLGQLDHFDNVVEMIRKSKIPSNIKAIKQTHPDNRCVFYFIDGKVYRESYHEHSSKFQLIQ